MWDSDPQNPFHTAMTSADPTMHSKVWKADACDSALTRIQPNLMDYWSPYRTKHLNVWLKIVRHEDYPKQHDDLETEIFKIAFYGFGLCDLA